MAGKSDVTESWTLGSVKTGCVSSLPLSSCVYDSGQGFMLPGLKILLCEWEIIPPTVIGEIKSCELTDVKAPFGVPGTW